MTQNVRGETRFVGSFSERQLTPAPDGGSKPPGVGIPLKRRSLFSSLRVRLGLLILLAVVPVLGLTLYTDLEERDLAISNVEGEVQQMIQFISMAQEQFIEGTRQLLVSLANHPEVRELEADYCSKHFSEMMEEYPRYVNLGAASLEGEVFCSAVPVAGSASLANQSWFKRTLETRDFTMGTGMVGKNAGKPTLNFGHPVIEEDGEVLGVVFAAVGLDQINQLTGELQLPENTELIFVAQNGTVLAYLPDPEKWVGQALLNAPLIKAILTKGTDVGEYSGLDGVSRLYAFTPVSSTVETGVYVCIGIPTSVAYSEANKVLLYHIVGLGIVTFMALLMMWVGGDIFILRRVQAILKAAQRLSGGDMKARTGLGYGAGELDQLAHTFDEMAATLERRAIEIRRAESKYRTLVEQLPVITYTCRLDDLRSPLYMSPQIDAVLGYAPEEFIEDPALWSKRIRHEDLPEVQAALARSRASRSPFRAEYRIVARDGRLLWFNDDAVVIHDEADGSQCLQGIMRDVTAHRQAQEALRQSEERFRLLVECVKDYAIFMLDPEGRIVSWNTGTERLTGYGQEEILGRRHSCFHTSEEMEMGVPNQELRTAEENGWFESEGWRVRKDGSSYWASVIITALQDKSGKLIGFSHITRDRTEHKRAEGKLIVYQDQLRSLASELSLAEERQRRRIAVELHDRVGQALAISKIKLGVLSSAAGCAESLALIDEVRKLVEQAIQDTRSLIFEISSPILYELGFEAALEWLAEQLQKQHSIETSYEDDQAPKPLDDDIRALLFHATGELLINAAKHACARNIKVLTSREGDYIRVSVEDDGVGFNVLETGPARGECYGFGLFSIRERLNYVGGRLEIDSVPGQGSRVALVAPLRPDRSA